MTRRPAVRRQHALVLATLLVGVPTVAAVGWAAGGRAAVDGTTPTGSTPVAIVAEQVSTARDIVPFGVTRSGEATTVWAVGNSRGQSTQDPGPDLPLPSTPAVEPPRPGSAEDDGEEGDDTPTKGKSLVGTRAAEPAASHDTLLLEGVAATAGATTVWKRAAAPLDTAGNALGPKDWRLAGADATEQSGASTPSGAAAMLAELGPFGGNGRTAAILARRKDDGRFVQLPEPSPAALAPATQLFDPSSREARLPFAVVDLPAAAGSTTPSRRNGTGVLIAPPAGDGVLAWNGTAWSEEPYLDTDGKPVGPRTVIALGATPDGDGVALLQNADAASPDRLRLYRRTTDHKAWREITLSDAPFLSGPLPADVTSIAAVPAPANPLTVTDGHWWLDLIAQRSSGEKVSVTVHLEPGRADASTAATTPVPDPDPAPTSSTPADPGATTPPGTTPTTPPADLARYAAKGTGTWCQTSVAGCTHELLAAFATHRGYRSQAFPGPGFGGRVITSPVIPEATGTEDKREASASGGYLQLSGDAFHIESGVGDDGDGHGGTQAAAFESESVGWIGARRAVGHLVPATTPATNLDDNTVYGPDAISDVALSPSDTDPSLAGAIELAGAYQMRRKIGDKPWAWVDSQLYQARPIEPRGTADTSPRAIAWPTADRIFVVGTGGLLVYTTPPTTYGPFDENIREQAEVVQIDGTAGMNFLDVAFNPFSPTNGWAVGRDGAVMRDVSDTWAKYAPPAPYDTADFWHVAFTGGTAWFATSKGLLMATPGAPDMKPVPALDKLIKDDGRDAGVRTVAGLDDGTVVVDARYVLDPATATWGRLPDPAEGDVIALAIARPGSSPSPSPIVTDDAAPTPDVGTTPPGSTTPGAGTTPDATTPTSTTPERPLTVVASIADSLPARRGSAPDPLPKQFGSSNNYGPSGLPYELPPSVDDGRVSQLGPNGWVDKSGDLIEPSSGRDLPFTTRPVQAIVLDENGNGYAAGGRGSSANFATSKIAPRGFTADYSVTGVATVPPVAAGPLAIGRTSRAGVSIAGSPNARGSLPEAAATAQAYAARAATTSHGTAARAATGRRADTDPAPTQGTTPPPTTPGTTPTTPPTTPATTPATTPESTTPPEEPQPVPGTPVPESNPTAPRIRIVVGGHPACVDECAGRDDQRVAPSETLREALATARRLGTSTFTTGLDPDGNRVDPRAFATFPPITATIIGGGRTTAGGTPLSAAGADTYSRLLHSQGGPPVLPVIGTGDGAAGASDAEHQRSRQNFATRVAGDPIGGSNADNVTPVAGFPPPRDGPDDPTVAYAGDLNAIASGADPQNWGTSPLRIIVIDNAGTGLRGGFEGRQARWLSGVLNDARDRKIPAIVVGGPALDAKSTLGRPEVDAELDLLISGGASAYVGTDGSDDPTSLSNFGLRARESSVARPAGTLEVIQSAALGHQLPYAIFNSAFDFSNDDDSNYPFTDYLYNPALIALDVDPKSRVDSTGQFDVRASLIPVVSDLPEADTVTAANGSAYTIQALTQINADNGLRYTSTDGSTVESIGSGFGDATPNQCRLYATAALCGPGALPTDVRFTTADPSIATFVRAKRGKPMKNSDGKTRYYGAPEIVNDARGNPVLDDTSPVLCPLRVGKTSYTISTGGISRTYPVEVAPRTEQNTSDPTATPGTAQNPTCAFDYGDRSSPAPALPTPAAPTVPVVPKPVVPTPHPKPAPLHHGHSTPTPLLPETQALTVPPVGVFPVAPAQQASPPVAPNPKPVSTMTPTPPSGVSTQQLVQQVPSPASQSLIASVRQEERKTEVAREGADHSATIYKASPRPDATTLLVGGALALLVSMGGGIAGRRRALARAAARAWLK